VDLIRTQRLAIAAGLRKNLDRDQPQHLTRPIPISRANPSGRHPLTSCAPSHMNSHR